IDQGSPGVTRIEQARIIREVQFPQDAGPRAHPVRPESYVEMNNFYTVTVYHKGAEVIRMMAEIAGRDAFIRGVQHYLHKHDGQAVAIEDFVVAMEESTGQDLAQFRRWYGQAGTPTVSAATAYDAASQRLQLTLRQYTPPTPGQVDKQALDIPVACALYDAAGKPLGPADVLRLQQTEQTWTFDDVAAAPTLSLLRGFSAPAKLDLDRSDEELARLMAHDDDPVSRWDAAQQLYLNTLVTDISARRSGAQPVAADLALLDAVAALLDEPPQDRALLAAMLTLPGVAHIGEQFEQIDMHAIIAARDSLRHQLAAHFAGRLEALADAHQSTQPYHFDVTEAGRRRVLGTALALLATLGVER